MADNAQKTPIQTSLQEWANYRLESFKKMEGKRIPATVVDVDPTGTIVTVKFEVLDDVLTLPQVECPVQTTEYARAPIRKGTKGYVAAAEYYIGGMTELGGGTAHLEQQPNLSNLIFCPLGNADFQETDDPNWYVIYGPEGVLIRTEDGETSLLLKKGGGVEINAPLGFNIFKANWVEASSDAEAKSFGIPYNGLYKHPDGSMKWQRIPD